MTPHREANNAMDRSHEPTYERASIQTIAFWSCTLIIALELFAGSMWALFRIPFDREQMAHLGYPLYMLYILGGWKLAGGAAILFPRFPRLKEWAYAGALFDFSGAVASHLFVGDSPTNWAYPAILVALTLVSWALRPNGRRLRSASSEDKLTITAWAVPVGIGAVMLLGALLTLPKGHFSTHCSGPCSNSGLARSR
jgi:uncharacterized membrane protein YphA (DoxX/SURF4 family)